MAEWVSHGLNAKDLGDYCFREIAQIMRGAAHRSQVAAWTSGHYALAAYHAPKDYPKCPELSAPQSDNPVVDAEIQDIRRRVKLAHDTKKAMEQNGR